MSDDRAIDDLLPDDPEAIRRIYRGLRTREALERVGFQEIDEGYLLLARWIDVALVLGVPLFLPGLYGGATEYVRTIGGYIALASATYGAYHLLGRNLLRHRFGRFHPYVERPGRFWAVGPASLLFLVLALPRRISPESIDPTSLDVLEPVAREIAAPLLASIRTLNRESEDLEVDEQTGEIDRRLAELAREHDEEPDAEWRARIDRRVAALHLRREAILADAARIARGRTELEAQAQGVERALDRLARHRRLLAELREDEEGEEACVTVNDLRARLAALGRSVEAIQRAGAARAGAEDELKTYLGGSIRDRSDA